MVIDPSYVRTRLPDPVFDRLLAGYTVAADVVTIAANCRAIPDIPLSDYHAAVEVTPDMDREWEAVGGLLHLVHRPETLRGFRVLYQEVPEQYLLYGFDYDLYATVREMTNVKTRQKLEEVLSHYVKDFGTFYVGRARYWMP